MNKKKVIAALSAFIFISIFSASIYADEVNQRFPNEDTWTQQESPGTNHGSDTKLSSLGGSGGGHRDMILKFNISDITSEADEVTNATISMFLFSHLASFSTQPFYASNQTWNEDQITYSNRNNTNQDYGVPGTILSPTGTGWHVWDITDIVEHARSQGDQNVTLFINATGGSNGNQNDYYSKENSDRNPYINVTFDTSKPQITITEPQNQTYYGITDLELNFSAIDPNNSTFTLNATLNGVDVYNNLSYQNDTFILQTENIQVDTNNFTVYAFDGQDLITETVIFDVFYGLNISVFEANGSAIQNWNINATNTTNWTFLTGNSNPSQFIYSILPQGDINITVNNTDANFDNQTKTDFNINNSMGLIETNFTLFRNQLFRATGGGGSPVIQNFNISFTNGTSAFDINFTTTDGQIEASTRLIPRGDNNITVTASGFNTTTEQFNINLSSAINHTFELANAGLTITVFDERNTSLQLRFDVTLTNTTGCSDSENDILQYSKDSDDLCLGRNTIAISNDSFIQDSVEFEYISRNYFLTLSTTANLSLTAYLLREDQGFDHKFTVASFTGVPIEDAVVSARRSIGGSFVPVEQGETDTGGTTTLFLDDTTSYQIVVEADGFVSETFTLNPSSQNTDTLVKLEATGEAGADIINVTTLLDSISFSLSPAERTQNQSFNVEFFISDSSSSLESFGMNITFRNTTFNFTDLVFNQTLTSPSGATITSDDLNRTGWYDVVIFFKKDGEDLYIHPTQTYFLTNGTGTSQFNTGDGMFHINTFRLIGILVLALSMAFFMRLGFLAGFAGGLGVSAILTFGLGIFPWQWWAMSFVIVLSLFIILRRI